VVVRAGRDRNLVRLACASGDAPYQEQIGLNDRQSWHRMEKRVNDMGTGYYWAPGRTRPLVVALIRVL
jgi:hypothetical protein